MRNKISISQVSLARPSRPICICVVYASSVCSCTGFSQGEISTLVQNALTFVSTAWFGFMNISKSGDRRARRMENGEDGTGKQSE